MADSGDVTHDVLVRVAEFLRRLPNDQLQALASGTASLEVVSRRVVAPARAVAPRAPAPRLPVRDIIAPADLPHPIEEIGATLAELADRAGAVAYLDGLNLRVVQLRSLAAGLGISIPSKATKIQARDTIIQWTVGRRADASLLGRSASRRSIF